MILKVCVFAGMKDWNYHKRHLAWYYAKTLGDTAVSWTSVLLS
jgi:hypothetical protein